MKRFFILTLLLCLLFNLSSQSLPEDLMAAKAISKNGSDDELLNRMVNYKFMQEKQLRDYYIRRDEISQSIQDNENKRKKRIVLGCVSLLAGAAAAGGYVYFNLLGDEAYENYKDTSITDVAVDYRDEFQLYDTLSYVSAGVGAVGIGSSLLFFKNPDTSDLQNEKSSLDKEIILLEEEMR